ncbi:M20 family metallo-hydrolase [Mesobacterium sp. TK19101]|uniref:M20 family metallo-hydrolase n=1 Tax=Mesobacterium hydrothermale TaxID=3111907 RepID=A0ABU6HGR0_9RHOB|nr:M20 family metallo-hydrolase [Mesobacterium sp. TK19101]MEC3860648.1 M20 family metallo-hydrolase [Mesobacterium sp. TK19101]
MDWGREAEDRLNRIARCSLPGAGITRFPFTDEHRAALEEIKSWMLRAGMTTRLDAAATLVGRAGTGDKVFLIGSHQDSVRDGGRYDGIMGIVIGSLAVEKLKAEGKDLAVAVEVLAFADEEGVTFPTALLGPRALAGTVDPAVLSMTDRTGETLRDALNRFGADAQGIAALARDPGNVVGYLEVHIEQGPALEQADAALGVVTGICGIERNTVVFEGDTGHAGTVPMESRRDALVAASDFIAAVHDSACRIDGLRATIGALTLHPGVANAIPSRVELVLEIRSLLDMDRERFAVDAVKAGAEIGDRRNVAFSMHRSYQQPAVPADAMLVDALDQACQSVCPTVPRLPSGATHDASAMADLCPMAMLFVRCRGGLSHRPEEYASPEDMAAAVSATAAFLSALAG